MLLGLILGGAGGLLVGWNLLPQPLWIKELWDKWTGKLKG